MERVLLDIDFETEDDRWLVRIIAANRDRLVLLSATTARVEGCDNL